MSKQWQVVREKKVVRRRDRGKKQQLVAPYGSKRGCVLWRPCRLKLFPYVEEFCHFMSLIIYEVTLLLLSPTLRGQSTPNVPTNSEVYIQGFFKTSLCVCVCVGVFMKTACVSALIKNLLPYDQQCSMASYQMPRGLSMLSMKCYCRVSVISLFWLWRRTQTVWPHGINILLNFIGQPYVQFKYIKYFIIFWFCKCLGYVSIALLPLTCI